MVVFTDIEAGNIEVDDIKSSGVSNSTFDWTGGTAIFGEVQIDTLNFDTLGTYTQAGNVDFNDNEMSNIKIVSGNIDNIKLGQTNPADARFLNIESGNPGDGKRVIFYGTRDNSFHWEGSLNKLKISTDFTGFDIPQDVTKKEKKDKIHIGAFQYSTGTITINNNVIDGLNTIFPSDAVGSYLVTDIILPGTGNTTTISTKITEYISDTRLICDGNNNYNNIPLNITVATNYKIFYPGTVFDYKGRLVSNNPDFIKLPAGSIADRTSFSTEFEKGQFRFNTDTNQFEGYDGTTWTTFGGFISQDAKTEIKLDKFINDGIIRFHNDDNESIIFSNEGKIGIGFNHSHARLITVGYIFGSTTYSNNNSNKVIANPTAQGINNFEVGAEITNLNSTTTPKEVVKIVSINGTEIILDKVVNWYNNGQGVSISYRNPVKASIDISGDQNSRIGITSPTLSSISFNGSKNDLSISGTYTSTAITDFKIEIDSTGTPDTFKWSQDNGSTYFVGNSVSLSSAPVTLGTHGISIHFGDTTGHSIGDNWSFTARNETKFNLQTNSNLVTCNLELDTVLKKGDSIKFIDTITNLPKTYTIDKFIDVSGKKTSMILNKDYQGTTQNNIIGFTDSPLLRLKNGFNNDKVIVDKTGNIGVNVEEDTVKNSMYFNTTDSLRFPSGTTTERPYNTDVGQFRYNTTTNNFEGRFDFGWSGMASNLIGNPTTGGYADDTLELKSTTNIPDAFQTLDLWINRYLVDTPPAPTLALELTDFDKIQIRWKNPEQIKIGFMNIEVPKINDINVEFKENSASTYTNLHTNTNLNFNEVQLYINVPGTNGFIDNRTYIHNSSIVSARGYDFRIFGTNDNTEKEKNYLVVNNVKTKIPGVPVAPTSLTATTQSKSQINTSWVKPDDHNIEQDGLQTIPFISQYRVNYEALSRPGRYPNSNVTDTNNVFTPSSTISNANTSLSITGLLSGTEYNFKVAARNLININYGSNSSVVNATTSLPAKPQDLSTSHLTSLSSNVPLTYDSTGTGRQLDGNSLPGKVININNINNDDTKLETEFSPNVSIHENFGDTNQAIICNISSNSGLNDFYTDFNTATIGLSGFGSASKNGTYLGQGNTKILIDENQDFYNGTDDSGFYLSTKIKVQSNNVQINFPPSTDKYSFNAVLIKTTDGISTRFDSGKTFFFIDDLNQLPVVTNAQINNVTSSLGTNYDFVSGVLTAKNGLTFNIQFNMTNIAHRFLRNDKKHADILIKTNSGSGASISNTLSITKDSITGSNKYFIVDPTGAYKTSTTLANTDGLTLEAKTAQNEIQFNTFSIDVANANNIFDESLGINITPYSLFGTGGVAYGLTKNPINNSSLGDIRIDTISITALAAITGSFGTLVRSGTGNFPFYGTGNNNFGGTYDHEQHVGTGAYLEDMIMYNGIFAPNGSGYKDYSSGYYDFSGLSTYNLPDYSSLSSTYRYLTFKYPSISNSTTAQLTITGTNFSNQLEDTDEMKLFVRIEEYCGWLDANKASDGVSLLTSLEYTGTTATVNGNSVTLSTPSPTLSNFGDDDVLIGRNILVNNVLGLITDYDGTNKIATVDWGTGVTPPSSGSYRIWRDGVPALRVSNPNASTGTVKRIEIPSGSYSNKDVYIRIGLKNTSNKNLTKIKFETGYS